MRRLFYYILFILLLLKPFVFAGSIGFSVNPEWVNIKTIYSLAKGMSYVLDNTGGDRIYYQISDTEPTQLTGHLIKIGDKASITIEKGGLWVRSADSYASAFISSAPIKRVINTSDNGGASSADINEEYSNMYNFSGEVLDLFNDLHSVIVDSTIDNPKELLVHFNSTIVSNAIGIGAYSGSFSNVEIQIGNSGGVFTTLVDTSSDDTDYTTQTYQLPITAGFNAIKIRFHTTDTITLSNIVVLKAISVVSRLQATKPDNTVTDINATNGGNLKVSLEEVESDISVNGNTQLKTTPYASTGTEYKIDEPTGAFVTASLSHHEIHEGVHYFICEYTLNEGASDVIEYVVTTPSLPAMHTTVAFSGSEGVTLEVYKGTTNVVGGTAITPRNNNGVSSNVSGATVIKDPTSMTDGTRVTGFLAGGGRVAGFFSRENERILDLDSTYLFRFTSLAVSNDIGWCFEWYEHTE